MWEIPQKLNQESLGKLNPKEIELIYWLRTRFRYGEVVIETRDGLPFQILKAMEFQRLGLSTVDN